MKNYSNKRMCAKMDVVDWTVLTNMNDPNDQWNYVLSEPERLLDGMCPPSGLCRYGKVRAMGNKSHVGRN